MWPSDGPVLPGSVRWIPAKAITDTLRWPDNEMPSGEWAGAIAFDYGSAWKLEALTAQGQCVCPRWRRNVGKLDGLRFETTDHGGGDLHVCEGEVTALALAVQCAVLVEGFAIAAGADPCRTGPGGTEGGAGTAPQAAGNPAEPPSQRTTTCINSIQAELTLRTYSLLKWGSGRQSFSMTAAYRRTNPYGRHGRKVLAALQQGRLKL